MGIEDKQLAAAACRGDKSSAVQLIELTYAPVFAFLRRLTTNDPDAADLTQRTFGRVWTALHSFAGRSSFNSWVHSIAYHVYLDWRRAGRRTESRPDSWWQAVTDAAPPPDEQTARADMAATLYAAVDRLDPDLRLTVHLRYYQHLTIEETAEAMGVAGSTVKYRLRQALDSLQKLLASEKPVPAAQSSLKLT